MGLCHRRRVLPSIGSGFPTLELPAGGPERQTPRRCGNVPLCPITTLQIFRTSPRHDLHLYQSVRFAPRGVPGHNNSQLHTIAHQARGRALHHCKRTPGARQSTPFISRQTSSRKSRVRQHGSHGNHSPIVQPLGLAITHGTKGLRRMAPVRRLQTPQRRHRTGQVPCASHTGFLCPTSWYAGFL